MMPSNITQQVRAFIGLVNYYRDMWARRPHLINLLTVLMSNKVNFKCTGMEHKSFYDIKHAVAQNTLLAYPDFNKRFDIHTDSSGFQLVAVIIQDGKPRGFYSCKLTGTQTQYTVTEKGLLSIVKTLK